MRPPKIVILVVVVGIVCCLETPTEMVINIHSEYRVPHEIDKIKLSLSRSENVFFTKEYPIISESELPVRILITQESDVEEMIGIEVEGKKGGTKVVRIYTERAFSRQRRVYVDLYLRRGASLGDVGGNGSSEAEDIISLKDDADISTDTGCLEGSCGQNAECRGGVCTCVFGFENCNQDWYDGCEVDIANDPHNCGICGKVCNPVNVEKILCTKGRCDYSECNIMYSDIDGRRDNGCERFNYFPKVYGGKGDDIIEDIQPTSDGGIILLGVTTSCCFGDRDFWILKLDRRGDIEWQKVIGGEREEKPPFAVCEYDGLYYITGSTSSYGKGEMSALMVVLDSNGALISAKIMDGGLNNWMSFNKMLCQSDSNCIILGNVALPASTGPDIFELSINKDLSITGQRVLRIMNTQENASFIKGWNGYVYFANNRINQTESSSTILMIDKNMGIFSAKEIYGDIGVTLTRCIQISSEGIYCSGYSDSSNPYKQEVVLIKYGYADKGEIVWQKAYGKEGSDYGNISGYSSITGLFVGGVIETGGAFKVLFMNLDTNGDLRFVRAYSGAMGEGGMYIVKHSDNLFLIGGISMSYSYGGIDLFIMPIDMYGINSSECHLDVESNIDISIKDIGLSIRDVTVEEIVSTDFSFESIDIGVSDMQDFKAGSICEE